MPGQWTISLGESAEKLAGMYEISRPAQDEFALRSHQRATAAWDAGFYDGWVVPVPGIELERDETIRADTTLEKLARLKPAFVEGGTVTAGNSSPLNDGAGALLMADERGAETAGTRAARARGQPRRRRRRSGRIRHRSRARGRDCARAGGYHLG